MDELDRDMLGVRAGTTIAEDDQLAAAVEPYSHPMTGGRHRPGLFGEVQYRRFTTCEQRIDASCAARARHWGHFLTTMLRREANRSTLGPRTRHHKPSHLDGGQFCPRPSLRDQGCAGWGCRGETERMNQRIRREVRVEGVVQGVGFRPFVYNLATGLALTGSVRNDVDGVFVDVEGPDNEVAKFLVALRDDAPALAVVERVTATAAEPAARTGFTIETSDAAGGRHTLVSADSATCADCLRELADPADRRFGYPFINCTNCGPRFTIVRDIPYDRPLTTMAGFAMCTACAAEYHDPRDRRFHAQPTCCPACGPRLRLLGHELGDPIAAAASMLREGKILAVKGLGGYHLAALAAHEEAAAELRRRKHREDKPFAVMAPDLESARTLCSVDELLTSRRRPIVLLPRRSDAPIAAA